MDKCVVPVDTLRFDVNAHSMENTMRVALAVPAHNGDENMACSLMNDAHREENTAHVKRDKDSRFVPVGAAHFADDHANAVRDDMVRFVMNDARVLMENDVCFVQVANKHFVDDNDPLLDHVTLFFQMYIILWPDVCFVDFTHLSSIISPSSLSIQTIHSLFSSCLFFLIFFQ